MYRPTKHIAAVDTEPLVSIVIPVRNERDNVVQSLASLLEQSYPNIELLVFDGMSTDGTRKLLEEMAQRFPTKMRLLDNPGVLQVRALNLGLREARGEVFLYAMAHALYDRDFVRLAVAKLVESGAAGVGCATRLPPAVGSVPRSIVALHRSKLGIGVARFRNPNFDGWADTFWVGVYWKRAIEEVGGYRDELERSYDIDLHSRLRAQGYGLYLYSKLGAVYYPRRSLGGLWKQNFGNGMAVAQTLFICPKALSLRHLVPGTFVLTVCLLSILSPVHNLFRYLLYASLATYGVALLVFSVWDSRLERKEVIPLMPAAFVVLHFGYGLGTIWGILKVVSRLLHGKDLGIFAPKAKK